MTCHLNSLAMFAIYPFHSHCYHHLLCPYFPYRHHLCQMHDHPDLVLVLHDSYRFCLFMWDIDKRYERITLWTNSKMILRLQNAYAWEMFSRTAKKATGALEQKLHWTKNGIQKKNHVTRGPLFTMISKSAAMAIKRALSNWRRNVYLINDHKLKFN